MAVQEDDATELQFPKGMLRDNFSENADTDELCSSCNASLVVPFIQCAECQYLIRDNRLSKLYLCLHCFTKGKEFKNHKNDHSYIFIQDTPIFTDDWKGKDELKLLDSISDCGLGNWNDISKFMPNKSAEECKLHFNKFYIDDHPSTLSSPHPVQYCSGSYDPPRPLPGTVAFQDMAGYNAARGDFTTEFQNNAESFIQDIDFSLFDEGEVLGQELQAAMLDIYRWQLGERHLRKRIASEHGLINMSRSQSSLHSYLTTLPHLNSLISKLFQLVGTEELIYILEGLRYQEELSEKIATLKDYRANGMKNQSQVSIYKTMKKRRESSFRQGQKLLTHGTKEKFISGIHNSTLSTIVKPSFGRRSAPLQISTLKDYDKLNETEKELAARLRIFPTNFLEFKSILINECIKNSGLTLSQARHSIKIDVNKVREIFKLLIREGCIYSKD